MSYYLSLFCATTVDNGCVAWLGSVFTFHHALWNTFGALYMVQPFSLKSWTTLQNGEQLIDCAVESIGVISD